MKKTKYQKYQMELEAKQQRLNFIWAILMVVIVIGYLAMFVEIF